MSLYQDIKKKLATNFFLLNNNSNIENSRRKAFVKILIVIGVVFLFGYGIFNIFFNNFTIGLIEIISSVFYILVLLIFHDKKIMELSLFFELFILCMVTLLIPILEEFVLHSFFWILPVPIITVFILGMRIGVPLSIFFLLYFIGSFLIFNDNINLDSAVFIRFVGAYSFNLMIVILFDYLRHRAYVKYSKQKKELELMVNGLIKTEASLKKNEKKYKALFKRATEGILIIKNRKIILTNESLQNLLGYKESEMKGLFYFDIVSEEEREKVKRIYNGRISGKDVPVVYESVLLNKNGAKVNVEMSGGLIDFEDSTADMVIVRDIRERKKNESQKMQLEKKNAALALAVTANHEMNQPLMILKGNLEILLESINEDNLTDNQKKKVKRINDSFERIESILQKFRDAKSVDFQNYSGTTEMASLKEE